MNSQKRQEQFIGKVDKDFALDYCLDFSDCKDMMGVAEAACKLLRDNFEGVAVKGSYIEEIIWQACAESMGKKFDYDEE